MLALTHADREQSADDVVDTFPHVRRVVGPVLVEEEHVARRPLPALLDEQAEGDSRVRLDPLESRQTRELRGRLARQVARAAHGALGQPERGPRHLDPHPAGELDSVADAVADLGHELDCAVIGDALDVFGQLTRARSPARPKPPPSAT